jgi:hypothetical protein
MAEWRMKILGTATDLFARPLWLRSYDVNAGPAAAVLTADPTKALTWPAFDMVLAVWKMQATVQPLRPDGRPNRPLTVYTIEPEQVPEPGPLQVWPKAGGLNIYTCQTCGGKTVTRDRDEGTTPMLMSCRATAGCQGRMQSAGYPKELPADLPAPTIEWIKPTPAELAAILAAKPKQFHRALQEHVAAGGLLDVPVVRH